MFHSSSSSQPAEVFRKDLISAMKLPDSYQLQQEEYWVIQDQWKQEWEKGVQVPVDDTSINDPQFFEVLMQDSGTFKIPDKLIKCYSGSEEQMRQAEERQRQIEATCQYDLDEVDIQWLHIINREREDMGDTPIDELTMEKIIEQCEIQCQKNIEHAIQTEEGLGIEYDEDICCAVCRAPDSEDGNEMVFCDKCDICVHQACYGVIKIPEGSWMCRCCALGLQPECMLCGKKGGAMKSTRSGTKWAHVNCALWIPEVSIGDVERMEPITKISQIPPSRWALICNLCRERTGACIQCSVKTCKTAYHVTCGVEQSLEMEQILDENKDVKFRSFCVKHTNGRRSPSFDGTVRPTPRKKSEEEKANARAVRIQRVTEEFQKYVKLKEVATSLNFKDDIEIADLVFEYWKLKRKSGFNKPLLNFPREDDKDKNSEEYNLHARMKMFVHLRQDLERVRNLCYMVQRREKLSRQMLRLREGLFKKQCEFFNGNLTRITDEEVDWAARAGEISARVPFPMSEDVILNKWLSIPSDGPKLMFDDDDDDETSEDDSDLEMEAKKERDKKKREKVAARKKKEAEVAARLKEKLAQVKGPVSSNTRGVKHRRVSSMDGKLIYEDEIRSRKGGTPTSHLSDSSSKSSPGGNDGGDEGESRDVTPERKTKHVSDTPDRESSETDSVGKNNSEPSKGNLNMTKKVKGKTPMKSLKSEKLKERPVSQNKLDQNDRKTFHRKEKPNSVQNHKLDHKPAKRKSIEKKEKDSKHSINNKDRKNFKDAKRKNTFERKKKSAGADSIHTKNHVIKEDPKNHFLGQGLEVKEEWTYWQTSEQRKVQSEKEVRHDEDKNAAEFLLQEVLGDRTLAPLTPFEEGHARSRFEDFIERHAEDQNAADFLANEIFDVKISSQDMKNKLTPLTDGIENNLKEQEFLAAERLLSGLDGKLPDWQEHGDLFGSKSDNLEDILGKEPFQLGPEDEKLVDKVLAQDIFQSQTRVSLKTNDESKKKRKSRQTGLDSIRETSKAKFKEQHKPEKKRSPDLAPKDHQRKKSDSKKAKEGKSNELSREHRSNHHSEDRLDSISGKSAEKRHNDMTSKVAKKQQHKKDNIASVDNRSLAGKNKKVLDDTRSSRDVGSGLKENGEVRQRSSEQRHSLSQAESNKTQKKQSNQPNRAARGMEQDSSEKELVASKKESRHTSRDDRTRDEGQKERTKSHKSRKINGERAQKEDERKLLSSKEKRDLGSSKTREGKQKPSSRKVENKPPVLSKGIDNPLRKQIDKKEKLPQSLKEGDKRKVDAKKMHRKSKLEEQPVLPGENQSHDNRDKSKSVQRSRRKHEDAESKKLAKEHREVSTCLHNGEDTVKVQSPHDGDVVTKRGRSKQKIGEMGKKTSMSDDVSSAANQETSIFDVQGIDDTLHIDKGLDTNEPVSIFDLDPSEELFKAAEGRRLSRRASSASSERGSQADSESTDDPDSTPKSKRRRRGTLSQPPPSADAVNKSASKTFTGLSRASRRRGSLSSDRSSLADSLDESDEKDTRLARSSGKRRSKVVTPSAVARLQSSRVDNTLSQEKGEVDSSLSKSRRKSEKSLSEHSADEPAVEVSRKSCDRPPTPTFARELPVGRDKGIYSNDIVANHGRALRRGVISPVNDRRDASEMRHDSKSGPSSNLELSLPISDDRLCVHDPKSGPSSNHEVSLPISDDRLCEHDSKSGPSINHELSLPISDDRLCLEVKEGTDKKKDKETDQPKVARRARNSAKESNHSLKLENAATKNNTRKRPNKESKPLLVEPSISESFAHKVSNVEAKTGRKSSTSTRRSRRESASTGSGASLKIVEANQESVKMPSTGTEVHAAKEETDVEVSCHTEATKGVEPVAVVSIESFNGNIPSLRSNINTTTHLVGENTFPEMSLNSTEDLSRTGSDDMPPLGPPETIPIDGLWPGQKSSLEKMADMVSDSSSSDLPPPVLELLRPPMAAKTEDAFVGFNHQIVSEANFARNFNVPTLEMVADRTHAQTVLDAPKVQCEGKISDGRRTSARRQSMPSNGKQPDKIVPTRTLRSSVDSSMFNTEISMKEPQDLGLFGLRAGVNPTLFPDDEKVDVPSVHQIINPLVDPREPFAEDGKLILPPPSDILPWGLRRAAQVPASKNLGVSVRRKSAPGQVPGQTQDPRTIQRRLQRNNSLQVDTPFPSQLNFPISELPLFSSLIPKDGRAQSSLWEAAPKDRCVSGGLWKQPSKDSIVLPGNVWEESPPLLPGKQLMEPFTIGEVGKVTSKNLFEVKASKTTQPFSKAEPNPPRSEGSWRDILDNMPKVSGFVWNPSDLPEFVAPRPPMIPATFSQFNRFVGDNVGLVAKPKTTSDEPPQKDDAPQTQDLVEKDKDKEIMQVLDKNDPSLSQENGIYFHKKLSRSLTQRRREVRIKAPVGGALDTGSQDKVPEVDCSSVPDNVKPEGSQPTIEHNPSTLSDDPSLKADWKTNSSEGKISSDLGDKAEEDTSEIDSSSNLRPEENGANSLEKEGSDRERFSRRLRDRKKVPEPDGNTAVAAKSKEKEKVDENWNITAVVKTGGKDSGLETNSAVAASPCLENELQPKLEPPKKTVDPISKTKANSKSSMLSPRRDEVSNRGISKRHLLADEFNKHIRGSPLKHGKDGRKKSSPQGTKKKTARRSRRQKIGKEEPQSKTKGGVFDFTSDEDEDQPAPIKLPKSPRVATGDSQSGQSSKLSEEAPPILEKEEEEAMIMTEPVKEEKVTVHNKEEIKESVSKEGTSVVSRSNSLNSNPSEINPIKRRWLSGSKTRLENKEGEPEKSSHSTLVGQELRRSKSSPVDDSKPNDTDKKTTQGPTDREGAESDQQEGSRRRSVRVRTMEKEAAAAKVEEEVKEEGPLNERRASLRTRRKDVKAAEEEDTDDEDTSLSILKKEMEESREEVVKKDEEPHEMKMGEASPHDFNHAESSGNKGQRADGFPVEQESGGAIVEPDTKSSLSELENVKNNGDKITVDQDNQILADAPAAADAAVSGDDGDDAGSQHSSHSDLKIEGADGRLVIRNWGKFSQKKKKKKKKKKSPYKEGHSHGSHIISNILESSTLCVKESSDGPRNGLKLKITTIDRYFKPKAKKKHAETEEGVDRREQVQTPIKLRIPKSRLSPSFKSNMAKDHSIKDGHSQAGHSETPSDHPREKHVDKTLAAVIEDRNLDTDVAREGNKSEAEVSKDETKLDTEVAKEVKKSDVEVAKEVARSDSFTSTEVRKTVGVVAKEVKKPDMDVFDFDTAVEDQPKVLFNSPTVGSKASSVTRELNHSTSSGVLSSPFDCPSPKGNVSEKRELCYVSFSEESDLSADGEKRQPHRKRRRRVKEVRPPADTKEETSISNSLQFLSQVVT